MAFREALIAPKIPGYSEHEDLIFVPQRACSSVPGAKNLSVLSDVQGLHANQHHPASCLHLTSSMQAKHLGTPRGMQQRGSRLGNFAHEALVVFGSHYPRNLRLMNLAGQARLQSLKPEQACHMHAIIFNPDRLLGLLLPTLLYRH